MTISVSQLKYIFYSNMLDELYERYCKKCIKCSICWRNESVFYAEKILKYCPIPQMKACVMELEENFAPVSLRNYTKLLGKLTLSLFDKFKIKRLNKPKYVGHYKNQNWKAKQPFYIIYCGHHDLFFIDYPHGYTSCFYCPLCLKETEQWQAKK